MTNWRKEGDFKNVNFNGYNDKEVSYHNDVKPNVVNKIKFVGFPNGAIRIEAETRNEGLHKCCEDNGFHQHNIFYITSGDLIDPSRIIKFIDIIRGYEVIDDITRDEMLTEIGIRIPEEQIEHQVFDLVGAKRYKDAIEMAEKSQEDRYYNVIWELAEYFFNKINEELIPIQQLFDLYRNISKQNLHYCEAQDKVLHILLLPQLNLKENDIKFLEKKFSVALEAKNKTLADQFFNQLCGYEMRSVNELTNKDIEGNPDVLILLARQIRNLNAENENLKSELARVKAAKATEVRSNLWSTASTTTSSQSTDKPENGDSHTAEFNL